MIKFNSRTHGYNWLSNFYPCDILYEWRTFLNVEAAYQASKCVRYTDKDIFLNLNGSDAKRFGNLVEMRSDWNKIKVPIMKELIRYKFNRPEFRGIEK